MGERRRYVVVDVQMRSIDLIDMNLNTSKGLEKTQITTRVDDKSKLKSRQPSIASIGHYAP